MLRLFPLFFSHLTNADGRPVRGGDWLGRRGFVCSPPEPAGETDRGEAHRSLPEQPSATGGDRLLTRRGLLDASFRWGGALTPAALGNRHPAADEGEGLRRADRALLRRVTFLAIETETGDSKLHCSGTSLYLRADSGVAFA